MQVTGAPAITFYHLHGQVGNTCCDGAASNGLSVLRFALWMETSRSHHPCIPTSCLCCWSLWRNSCSWLLLFKFQVNGGWRWIVDLLRRASEVKPCGLSTSLRPPLIYLAVLLQPTDMLFWNRGLLSWCRFVLCPSASPLREAPMWGQSLRDTSACFVVGAADTASTWRVAGIPFAFFSNPREYLGIDHSVMLGNKWNTASIDLLIASFLVLPFIGCYISVM